MGTTIFNSVLFTRKMIDGAPLRDDAGTIGIGLFAARDLKKGEFIYVDHDIVFDDENQVTNYLAFLKTDQERADFIMFSYTHNGKLHHPLGPGRFINHSSRPNLVYIPDENGIFAKHDIKKGELLTENYGDYGTDGNSMKMEVANKLCPWYEELCKK